MVMRLLIIISSFSKDNAITYCHFPTAKYHIESENIDYLKTDIGISRRKNQIFLQIIGSMKILFPIIDKIAKQSSSDSVEENKNVLTY